MLNFNHELAEVRKCYGDLKLVRFPERVQPSRGNMDRGTTRKIQRPIRTEGNVTEQTSKMSQIGTDSSRVHPISCIDAVDWDGMTAICTTSEAYVD